MDFISKLAVDEIIQKYNPHTIFVYGSRARGDATEESDVDILCFVDNPPVNEDFRQMDSFFLDAFIYSTEDMKKIDQFIKLEDAFCARDKFGLGEKLLKDVATFISKGPKSLSQGDKMNKISLILKALKQIEKADIEGLYRRSLLQTRLLEMYFCLRNLWFFGPKKSFTWLIDNDRLTYEYFAYSYRNPTNFEALKKLTLHVIDINKS